MAESMTSQKKKTGRDDMDRAARIRLGEQGARWFMPSQIIEQEGLILYCMYKPLPQASQGGAPPHPLPPHSQHTPSISQ